MPKSGAADSRYLVVDLRIQRLASSIPQGLLNGSSYKMPRQISLSEILMRLHIYEPYGNLSRLRKLLLYPLNFAACSVGDWSWHGIVGCYA